MMRSRSLAFGMILLVMVTACVSEGVELSQTETPRVAPLTATAVRSDTPPPTATPAPTTVPSETPPPKTAPMPTVSPTEIPLHHTAPYDKIPDQTDDGWQVASLEDVGINPVWMTKMLESIYSGEQGEGTHALPETGSKYQGIHNILIVKDGRLVYEIMESFVLPAVLGY